jgi:hypothetical protein
MVDFLKEYWDEIVAFVDKIYAAIKEYILKNAE